MSYHPMTRIIKKSTKEKCNIIKATVNDKNIFDKMVEKGRIPIGYTMVRVKPWHFGTQINQCLNCCKFGHSSIGCKNSEICLRCSGSHSYKTCPVINKANYICANCNGCHAACSKSCPVMISKEEDIKKKNQILLIIPS